MATSHSNRKSGSARALALVFVSVAFVSCGKGNPLIQNVNLKTEDVNGNTHLVLDAQIGQNLPALIPIVLPIPNVGQIAVVGNHVVLDIDATAALRLHSCDGKLPNGTAIPVTVPVGLSVACIPIGGSDSRVYVAVSGKQWLAGFALALRMESPVKVPLNVFLPIPLKDPSLQAVGGTFFGPLASGLAVFATKSDSSESPTIGAQGILAARSAAAPEFKFKVDSLTSSRQRALENAYYSTDDRRLKVD